MTACFARDMRIRGSCETLIFAEEAQRFAEAWHDAGLPVPADYLNPEGRPTGEADREYQLVRGLGDGRRVVGVDPRAASATDSSSPAVSPSIETLGPEHLVELMELTQGAVILALPPSRRSNQRRVSSLSCARLIARVPSVPAFLAAPTHPTRGTCFLCMVRLFNNP